MTNGRTCDVCRWFDSGQCRRYPPAPVLPGGFSWPSVAADHWCGEWAQREPPEVYPEPEPRLAPRPTKKTTKRI